MLNNSARTMHLGVLSSHPIQYQAPWFRALAREVTLDVYFAHRPNAGQQGAGFGKAFVWDVDLLSGYAHHFLTNLARRPAVNHFSGCNTPEIRQIILRGQTSDCGQGRAGSFDAFIVTGWHLKSYWQAVRACRRVGVPVLVRGDSQLLTPRSWPKRWAKEVVHRLLLRQFDGFLVVGQRNREYLSHYGVPEQKMYFAPHFVDNDWFAARAAEVREQRTEIRSKWGISQDAFCAAFCGKFIPKKRPMDLVKAATLLLGDGRLPKLHLLFIGSGESGTELRAGCRVFSNAGQPNLVFARREGLSPLPLATFAGFLNQTEIAKAYVAADALVLPSDGGETWGLVVNEAMACGLPAIVSDVAGCAPDLIEEASTGFTFPLGQDNELATRLAALAQMNSAGHDFRAALEEKLRHYSIQAAVHGTLRAVCTVIPSLH